MHVINLIQNENDKSKFLWFKDEVEDILDKITIILNQGSDSEETI